MILVDSNILLDVLTIDPKWYDWSASKLSLIAESHGLIINHIIYAKFQLVLKELKI